MNVKRNTVRFQDSLSNLSVYEAISNYKQYCYRSESHMVIEAVRNLINDGSANIDVDKLAEKLADKLSGKLTVSSSFTPAPKAEDAPSSEDAFNAALSFLDNF